MNKELNSMKELESPKVKISYVQTAENSKGIFLYGNNPKSLDIEHGNEIRHNAAIGDPNLNLYKGNNSFGDPLMLDTTDYSKLEILTSEGKFVNGVKVQNADGSMVENKEIKGKGVNMQEIKAELNKDITTGNYELSDSGSRHQFASGAVRDCSSGKGDYSLISPIATKRLAIVLEKGKAKYSARNWELGMNLAKLVDSAKRHLDQYLEGNRDEDHAGQCYFNIMALIHTEEMIKRGFLPAELNDLPNYVNPTKDAKN